MLGWGKSCAGSRYRFKCKNANNPCGRLLPSRSKGKRHRTAHKPEECSPPHADTSSEVTVTVYFLRRNVFFGSA
jgi:hypothetical protein